MHLLLFKMELVPKLLSRAESFLPAPDMVKLRSAVPAGWLKNYVLGAPVVTVLHKTLMSFPGREVFRTSLSRRQHLGGRVFQSSELQKQGPVLDVSA
jgi:hypothetical protein